MVTIKVRVKPSAKKTELIGIENGVHLINIKAPAEKNKANKELINFLQRQFKKRTRILSGQRNRDKVIELL